MRPAAGRLASTSARSSSASGGGPDSKLTASFRAGGARGARAVRGARRPEGGARGAVCGRAWSASAAGPGPGPALLRRGLPAWRFQAGYRDAYDQRDCPPSQLKRGGGGTNRWVA